MLNDQYGTYEFCEALAAAIIDRMLESGTLAWAIGRMSSGSRLQMDEQVTLLLLDELVPAILDREELLDDMKRELGARADFDTVTISDVVAFVRGWDPRERRHNTEEQS